MCAKCSLVYGWVTVADEGSPARLMDERESTAGTSVPARSAKESHQKQGPIYSQGNLSGKFPFRRSCPRSSRLSIATHQSRLQGKIPGTRSRTMFSPVREAVEVRDSFVIAFLQVLFCQERNCQREEPGRECEILERMSHPMRGW